MKPTAPARPCPEAAASHDCRPPKQKPYWNRLFDTALDIAGIEHEIVAYDGAPHSFFDRKQEEFQADSEDAWRRTLEFIVANA